MTDQELIDEVMTVRESRAKALGGRKALLRRLSALSAEAILEAALGAYFPAERFIEDAEVHERALKYRKLDRELARLLEKNKAISCTDRQYARNSERVYEIFDEMDLINDPNGEMGRQQGRTPMSKKYQRLAEVNARVAERKARA